MANDITMKPSSKIATSPALIGQLTFNEPSVALKTINSGACWDPLGAGNAVKTCGAFASLMFANTDTAGHWVTFGTANTVVAGTTFATSLWLPPQSLTVYASGTSKYVICDSALVGVYQLEDNLAEIQPSPAPPAPLAAAPADS